MNAAEFTWAIGRATVFTSASVLAAILLLRLLNIRSPRIHRATWLLAVLPGWLLVPWTLQIESAPVPALATTTFVQSVPTFDQPTITATEAAPTSRTNSAGLLLMAWLGGFAIVLSTGALRYLRFVRQLPSAIVGIDLEWQREWERQTRAWQPRRRIELRVTPSVGPLLCFVPFRYLVVVPCALWIALTRQQRYAILRHELAHWQRGDLWWSLAIRVLALPQWFNPLAWLAVRRFDEAGEWACDDLVSRGRRSRELAFARSLLATAEYATVGTPGTAAFQGGELARRVQRLVSQRFKEEAMAKKFLVLVPMAAIVLMQAVRIERVTAEEPAQASAQLAGKIDVESEPTSPAPDGIRPAYIIEPPDVLSINGVRLIPKPPHKIEPFDGLLVRVIGALPDHPIADAFAVDSDGKIDLGPPYGRVEVAGLTVDKAKTAIEKRLHDVVTDPDVSLSLAFSAAAQKIQGKYLVAPDGRVNLGVYGTVFVAGLTIEEARRTIEKRLSEDMRDPQVVVDVANYNSKKYYVITRHAGRGDNVVTVPITGSDTVLDALALVDDALKQSTTKIWISRPSDHGDGPSKILHVRWGEIVDGTSTATNYQLLPGDRLFVVNAADAADTKREPKSDIDAPQPPSPYYYPVQDQPKPIVASKSKSVNSVQFDIDMIEDRTGALAEYASMRGEAAFVAVDSETIGPALRVLSKHGLVRQIASPKITCPLGETATMVINEEPNADYLNLSIAARETELGMLMELRLKASPSGPWRGIDFAAYLKPGQTVLVSDTEEPSKIKTDGEPYPFYLAITPSFPRTPPTATGQDAVYDDFPKPPKAE